MRALLIFTFLFISVCYHSVAAAQISKYRETVNIQATANIVRNMSLVTLRDVNVQSGSTIDGKLTIAPTTSPLAGLIKIEGTPNALVRITYLTAETLIDELGSGALIKATYRLSGFQEDNQLASLLLDVGEANVRLSREGRYYLWLGAVLDLTKAGPGNYTSDFIIEIEEN